MTARIQHTAPSPDLTAGVRYIIAAELKVRRVPHGGDAYPERDRGPR